MGNIDNLRKRLHESIDKGNKEEQIRMSQELDIEIVKVMRKILSYTDIAQHKNTI